MKLKFTPFMFVFISITMYGCKNNEENKINLLSNHDYLTTQFVEGTKESFDTYFSLNIPFLVYFTSDGCSSCQSFKPIFENYLVDNHPLIFKVEGDENIREFAKNYDGFFFQNNEENEPQISVPYVGIVSNNKCERIENKKYMITKKVFKNHLASLTKVSNISFLTSELNLNNYNNDFTYISFNNNEEQLRNVYNEKIVKYLKNTRKNTVISNYNASELTISKFIKSTDKSFEEKEKIQVNLDTESSILETYF